MLKNNYCTLSIHYNGDTPPELITTVDQVTCTSDGSLYVTMADGKQRIIDRDVIDFWSVWANLG